MKEFLLHLHVVEGRTNMAISTTLHNQRLEHNQNQFKTKAIQTSYVITTYRPQNHAFFSESKSSYMWRGF